MSGIKKVPIIAYVAYGPFGLEYLKKFLDCYTKFKSGAKHKLLICFKGFNNYNEIENWKNILKCDFIEFFEKSEKNDFDIGSYYRIAEYYPDNLILFLDTHTRMNCDNWLKIFLDNYSDKRLLGSTGSYASITSQFFGFYYLQHSKIQQLWWGLHHLKNFQLFPNPHIRTTGFLLKGSELLELNFKREKFIRKIDTNYFESGRKNITKQLQKKGYKIGIVNADNVFFSVEDWKKSNTYCLNKQDKLVFKDNRTDEFERSSPEMKKKMSKFCWGM